MADNKKAVDTLDKIVQLMLQLKTELSDAPAAQPVVPEAKKPEPVVHTTSAPAPAKDSNDIFDSFDALKSALTSNKWPEAVNPHLICNPQSNEDKIERGRGIIELMISEDLKGLKFLDYGCGEGHCASLSADYATSVSVGFDTKKYDQWDKFGTKPNLLFTNTFSDVQARGPFDVIVLFDVIDHLTSEDAATVLKKAASVLAPNGKIYLRTHPFISRHGTHLYHDLNKAYAHLVFTPEEIKQIVPDAKYTEPSIGVIAPIVTYNKFITEAGLKISSKREITEKVEPFFKIPRIAERIMKNTGMTGFPEFQMSLQFIDYVLVKN